MNAASWRVVVDELSFPEGLRWHRDALWFSDIHGHSIGRLEQGVRITTVARLGDRASGLGFLPDGRLLVVSMLDRRLIAIDEQNRQRVHADLSSLSGRFLNDMVVDAEGRAYVGSRNGGPPESRGDSLIRVEPDGRARIEIADMSSPNGAVITPDGSSLIVAETAFGRLLCFALRSDGSLATREVVFEDPGLHIDGICLDPDGDLWAGGGRHGLLRISSAFELVDVIESPGRMVLATALGGPAGRTLFLATAGQSLLANLAKVGFDRSLDAAVRSEGRIEALELPAANVRPELNARRGALDGG